MRGEELWDSLGVALGPFAEKARLPEGLRQVLERIREPDAFTVFRRLFDYDPSVGANEVEPTVAQALMLMNNPAINARIRAEGDTPLARILAQAGDDDDAIRRIYLQVLSRHPAEGELCRCRDYVRKAGDRAEAMEDLMWALMNATEFRFKH
jgi:hypothetical protein